MLFYHGCYVQLFPFLKFRYVSLELKKNFLEMK